jgi:N-acetylmuramoyl-L-alanine amidase
MFQKLFIFVALATINITATYAQPTDPNTPNGQTGTAANLGVKKLKKIVIDAGHGGNDVGAVGEHSTEGKKLEKEMPDVKIIYTRTTEALPGNLSNRNSANRLRAQIANDAHADLFIAIHCNATRIKYETVLEGYRTEEYTVWVGKGKKKRKETRSREVPIYKRYKAKNQVQGTQTYIWAANKNASKKEFVGKGDFGEEADSAFSDVTTPEQLIIAALRTQKFFKNSYRVSQLIEEEFANTGRNSMGVYQRNWEGIWVLQATNMPSILIETGFISSPEEEDYLASDKGQHELMDAVAVAIKKYKKEIETLPTAAKDSTQNKPATTGGGK